jgi:chorismate mutase/prephenate dehydratase
MTQMNLDDLRSEIDRIDRKVLDLLNERVRLAAEIGKIKHSQGLAVYAPQREEEVFRKLQEMNSGPLDENAIRSIYREVISAAIALEKTMVIAYLGPEATFTHQAALKKFGSSVGYLALSTINDIFTAVEKGEADYGVIPIENSTEGAVIHSLDTFVDSDLKIVAQVFLEISHHLISQSGLKDIQRIYSKDQALGQCRRWLERYLPHATFVEADSTSRAVEIARDDKTAAAVASELAAELYKVPIVARNIQDKADNMTRFLVVGEKSAGPVDAGNDRSSYLISIRDEPGALQRALEPFSERGINLCKIESRPSKRKAWDYYFFVDILGHHDDEQVREAIAELERRSPMVKWLGSFPDSS